MMRKVIATYKGQQLEFWYDKKTCFQYMHPYPPSAQALEVIEKQIAYTLAKDYEDNNLDISEPIYITALVDKDQENFGIALTYSKLSKNNKPRGSKSKSLLFKRNLMPADQEILLEGINLNGSIGWQKNNLWITIDGEKESKLEDNRNLIEAMPKLVGEKAIQIEGFEKRRNATIEGWIYKEKQKTQETQNKSTDRNDFQVNLKKYKDEYKNNYKENYVKAIEEEKLNTTIPHELYCDLKQAYNNFLGILDNNKTEIIDKHKSIMAQADRFISKKSDFLKDLLKATEKCYFSLNLESKNDINSFNTVFNGIASVSNSKQLIFSDKFFDYDLSDLLNLVNLPLKKNKVFLEEFSKFQNQYFSEFNKGWFFNDFEKAAWDFNFLEEEKKYNNNYNEADYYKSKNKELDALIQQAKIQIDTEIEVFNDVSIFYKNLSDLVKKQDEICKEMTKVDTERVELHKKEEIRTANKSTSSSRKYTKTNKTTVKKKAKIGAVTNKKQIKIITQNEKVKEIERKINNFHKQLKAKGWNNFNDSLEKPHKEVNDYNRGQLINWKNTQAEQLTQLNILKVKNIQYKFKQLLYLINQEAEDVFIDGFYADPLKEKLKAFKEEIEQKLKNLNLEPHQFDSHLEEKANKLFTESNVKFKNCCNMINLRKDLIVQFDELIKTEMEKVDKFYGVEAQYFYSDLKKFIRENINKDFNNDTDLNNHFYAKPFKETDFDQNKQKLIKKYMADVEDGRALFNKYVSLANLYPINFKSDSIAEVKKCFSQGKFNESPVELINKLEVILSDICEFYDVENTYKDDYSSVIDKVNEKIKVKIADLKKLEKELLYSPSGFMDTQQNWDNALTYLKIMQANLYDLNMLDCLMFNADIQLIYTQIKKTIELYTSPIKERHSQAVTKSISLKEDYKLLEKDVEQLIELSPNHNVGNFKHRANSLLISIKQSIKSVKNKTEINFKKKLKEVEVLKLDLSRHLGMPQNLKLNDWSDEICKKMNAIFASIENKLDILEKQDCEAVFKALNDSWQKQHNTQYYLLIQDELGAIETVKSELIKLELYRCGMFSDLLDQKIKKWNDFINKRLHLFNQYFSNIVLNKEDAEIMKTIKKQINIDKEDDDNFQKLSEKELSEIKIQIENLKNKLENENPSKKHCILELNNYLAKVDNRIKELCVQTDDFIGKKNDYLVKLKNDFSCFSLSVLKDLVNVDIFQSTFSTQYMNFKGNEPDFSQHERLSCIMKTMSEIFDLSFDYTDDYIEGKKNKDTDMKKSCFGSVLVLFSPHESNLTRANGLVHNWMNNVRRELPYKLREIIIEQIGNHNGSLSDKCVNEIKRQFTEHVKFWLNHLMTSIPYSGNNSDSLSNHYYNYIQFANDLIKTMDSNGWFNKNALPKDHVSINATEKEKRMAALHMWRPKAWENGNYDKSELQTHRKISNKKSRGVYRDFARKHYPAPKSVSAANENLEAFINFRKLFKT